MGYDKTYRKRNPWFAPYDNAKTRCTNPKNISYKNYGGRGIDCELSLKEAKELWFRDNADSMKRPSLDRIDNDGNYSAKNCRFIELSENIGNSNRIRVVTDKQREAGRLNLKKWHDSRVY